MQSSYTILMAKNVEDNEFAAMREILAGIHEQKMTWQRLLDLAKNGVSPKADKKKTTKKDQDPKTVVCGKCRTVYPEGDEHTCDPERLAEVAASKSDAEEMDHKKTVHTEIDTPKMKFIKAIVAQYGNDIRISEQALKFVDDTSENIGKDVNTIYSIALKEWSGFVSDFAKWREAMDLDGAGTGSGPGGSGAGDGEQTDGENAGGPDPGDYESWKNLRNAEKIEAFFIDHKSYFEKPGNARDYFKAKEKWHRSKALKGKPFPYQQLDRGPEPDPISNQQLTSGSESEVNGSAANNGKQEASESNATAGESAGLMLLGTFPPDRTDDESGKLLLGIRRALTRAEMIWPDICKAVQEDLGFSLEIIKMMRDASASYAASYEYLAEIIARGIDAERNPASLKPAGFNGSF